MTPTVSVVIPTYNRAAKVDKTIDSALEQTISGVEVIVVDDGSSDDTRALLGKKYGNRIHYHYQPNQGASGARNRGITEARGKWIAFLDSDDLWEKHKLELQLKTLEQYGDECGACYTDTRFYNNSETRTLFEMARDSYWHREDTGINGEALRLLVRPGGAGMVVCLSSLLARADLVREAGGFDIKLLYSQDSEFMFRLALQTRLCYVNRPLVWFDRSPAEIRHVGVSSQWNQMDFFLQDSQVRLEKLLGLGESVPAQIRDLIREQLSSIHSGWTNWYLEAGQYGKARGSVTKAAKMHLNRNIALKWLLTWTSPALARHAVRRRLDQKKGGFVTV